MVFGIRESRMPELLGGTTHTSTAVLAGAVGGTSTEEMDHAIMAALRATRQHNMGTWREALFEHRNHPTFLLDDDPMNRQFGFTCACSGTDTQWRVPIADLREALPETRESILRWRDTYLQRVRKGSKKARQEKRRSDAKARALLHRYLTKVQRWDLRATESFKVVAQDGKTYVVTKQYSHSVSMLERGVKRYTFCLVPKVPLPVFDLMLAHKLLLEGDLLSFYEHAHATDNRTGKWFASGLELLEVPVEDPGPIPLLPPTEEDAGRVIPIMRVDIDNPEHWVRQQVQAAGVHLPGERFVGDWHG